MEIGLGLIGKKIIFQPPFKLVDPRDRSAEISESGLPLLPYKVRQCLGRHRDLQAILELLATGMSYKEVKAELNLGKGTVKDNVKALCIACGREGKRETALQLAEYYGLIPLRTFR